MTPGMLPSLSRTLKFRHCHVLTPPLSSSVLSLLFLLSQSHIPDLFLSPWDGPALCIPLLTRLECYLMNLFSHYSVNDDSCSSARRPPGEDGFNQQIMEIKVSPPKE